MTPRYTTGARVRVADRDQPGHVRTPHYIRGRTGEVALVVGAFRNPEELAVGASGLPERVLYRVRFRQRDVWPSYPGPAADSLDVEIYEHWLEGA